MHVSAGNPFRRWPAARFAAVAAALAAADSRAARSSSRPGRRIATPPTASSRQARAAGWAPPPRGIVRMRRVRPGELRALIGRAALYIGGDSGPLHIAAHDARRRSSALYGPTLPARSMPWRDPAVAATGASTPGPLPCRPCDQRALRARRLPLPDRHLGPNAVIEAAEQALADGAARVTADDDADAHGGRTAARSRSSGSAVVGAARLRRRAAVLDRRRADPAGASRLLVLGRLARAAPASASRRPRFFWPLLVYAALTLVSAGVLARPARQLRRLQAAGRCFLIVPVAYDLRAAPRAHDLSTSSSPSAPPAPSRHRPVRDPQLRQPRAAAAGRARRTT